MTRTLTTEQLRSRAAAYRTDAATLAEMGDKESSQRLNESANAFDELAANREAQPVGEIHTVAESRNPGVNIHMFNSEKIIPNGTKLYAAPPAPAVVKLPTEFYSDEGIVVRLEQVMAALAVVGVKYERKGGACRAAMLAQPVSGGYKLVPVEVLSTATRLIDLCRTYIILHGTSDYRVRTINECENTIEVIDGLLAAAPEGGNDHDTRR
ncbi:hypothetical protein [Serratia marcescens]|uniref:hypothetical protein n=1 Tax=Serratia marcescens TaxID=615 RepID=UPI000E1D0A8C|nr:hypothetical protein [Serratia marcescens]